MIKRYLCILLTFALVMGCSVLLVQETRAESADGEDAVAGEVKLGKPGIEVENLGEKNIRVILSAATAADAAAPTGYQIYRSRKENGGYSQIASVAADVSGYKDTSVTKGRLYFYKVRAYYLDEHTGIVYVGPFSDKRMCCSGAKNFPDTDTLNYAAEMKSAQTVRVSWENASGFVPDTLCYSCREEGENTFGEPVAVELDPKAKGYTIKNVKAGREYEILLLVKTRVPYNDGNGNVYFDSRWYVLNYES